MNVYTKRLINLMKWTSLVWTVLFLQIASAANAQRVTIKGKKLSLQAVLTEVYNQTGYTFLGNSKLYAMANAVDMDVQNMQVEEAVSLIFKEQPLGYAIKDRTILVHYAPAQAQELISVSGVVRDSVGQYLVNATVKVLNSDKVAFAGLDGRFHLDNVAKDATLVVSFVGFYTKRVVARSSFMDIVLEPTNQRLDEVNINTGYQKISNERATGAYNVVDKAFLNNRMETNIIHRIEGSVPGLFLTPSGVNIRGVSTVYGSQSPLYVVDGFPYEGSLDYLNPADIVNVTVLKDAAAASIYGTRAANGVISITTRRGSQDRINVSYNSSLFIYNKPDIKSLRLLNGRQMVDLQEELFNIAHLPFNAQVMRSAQPKALEYLYAYDQKEITQQQLQGKLNYLRGIDNKEQISDLLMQRPLKHQHYFSVSGGNANHLFNGGINFIGDRGYDKGGRSEQVNINLSDLIQVTKWLQADAGLITNISKNKYASINSMSFITGNYMPYENLVDEQGNRVAWNYMKSPKELERLRKLGLYDETYNPLNESDLMEFGGRSTYFRIQGGLKAKISSWLNWDLRYQTERGTGYGSSFYDENSYVVKSMVNNATQIINGKITQNIPFGGQFGETRSDSKSYTLRTQLNVDKSFGSLHHLTALVGAERRAVSYSSTTLYRLGYDPNNLNFLPIDESRIADVQGTQSLQGNFQYRFADNNYFRYGEDRYVSFYGNAGYNYKEKYNLTGSMRIDNSNFFGTDPKYRYRPLWSIGGSWHLAKEQFLAEQKWISQLSLRATYGINGNVAKNVGPFLQAKNSYNTQAQAWATDIINPPNRSLRWERTAVTNIGVDYGFLQNRISGTLDFYYRNSTDLLGEKETDPTNAFRSALMNYGSMVNKGVELGIQTVNVQNKNFRWATRFNASYNKNKMTEISTLNESIYSYTMPYGANKIGHPINSLFNFKYAGLDPTNGTVLLYDADGNVVKNYDKNGHYVETLTDVNSLVYSGPIQPKYTLSLTNVLNYKQFSLSIFVIANGGNVMRDVVPYLHNITNLRTNIDERGMNFWRKPGDEKDPNTMPAMDISTGGNAYAATIWHANDRNLLKADYIKVRDISFSYDFARTVFKKGEISSARVSLQVQNPVNWFANKQHVDPEAYSKQSNWARRLPESLPVYMLGLSIGL